MRDQLSTILNSPEWDRLSGTILWVPTENDPRPKASRTTRQTHSLQVFRIARQIAHAWNSEDTPIDLGIVGVAAVAHDLAHLPYGHSAEKVLTEIHAQVYPENTNSKHFFRHEINGGIWYTRVVQRYSMDAARKVIDAIREHRKPYKRKSTIESTIVSIADDIATMLSNFADGQQLPRASGDIGIYPSPLVHEIMCELGGHTDLPSWEREAVILIRPWAECRDILDNSQDDEFYYVRDDSRRLFKILRQLPKYESYCPAILGHNLNLRQRLKGFWKSCKQAGLKPDEALKRLIGTKEVDLVGNATLPN